MTERRDQQPAVVIIGSGALGSLFAAFLEPHARIVMLGHWSEQIETVKSKGLTCVNLDGVRSRHQFPVTDNARELGTVRLALVLVKSYQTARSAIEIAPMLAPDGLVVTLQNGLGNYEILEATLGYGRVAQGITAQGATLVRPGLVRHAGQGYTYIAATPGKERTFADLIDLLERAGLMIQMTNDVKSLQWGKLAINAGINPLTAILRVKNGYLAKNELASQVMCAAAEETATIASALEISLPFSSASRRAIEVAEDTADNLSSMLQDVLRGAPTEIDAINGAVADYGRKLGIPAPINEELWRLVKELDVGQDNQRLVHSHKQLIHLVNLLN